jgi:hypothetical protein
MRRSHVVSAHLLALWIWVAGGAQAQGAASAATVGAKKSTNERGAVAANNEWIVGTQLGVRFFGQGDFADNLLISGMVRYEVPLNSKTFKLPIFSNFGEIASKPVFGTKADSLQAAASALMSTAQGMNVGVYPYHVLKRPTLGGDLRVTAFGQIVGKLNSVKGRSSLDAPDTAEKVQHTLLQGRGALGVEVAVGKTVPANSPRRPLTLSLTAAATTFSARTYELVFGTARSSIKSVEFTAIVPVADGAGILVEGIGANGYAGTWRIGMVLAASNQ